MHIQNDVKESRKKVRECGEGMSAAWILWCQDHKKDGTALSDEDAFVFTLMNLLI